jgi:hypothetical protein
MVVDIVNILVKAFRQNVRARKISLAVSLLVAAVSLPLVLFSELRSVPAASLTLLAVLISSTIVVFSALASYGVESVSLSVFGLTTELSSIRQEREILRERVEDDAPGDVFASLELNLNQLTEYYTINKAQAKNSFRFGVFTIVLGLGIIAAGIVLFYTGQVTSVTIPALTSIAGLMAQFIGASSLYLHRMSLHHLTRFYSELVRLQKTMIAIRLCELLPDGSSQTEARKGIIAHLASSDVAPAD